MVSESRGTNRHTHCVVSLALPQAYSADERTARELVFAERLQGIVEHNADASQTWKKGVNEVSGKFESVCCLM
jgi:hypothetical protein